MGIIELGISSHPKTTGNTYEKAFYSRSTTKPGRQRNKRSKEKAKVT